MSNQNDRAQQRAAAQQYYDDLEVRANRRERRRRTISMFVVGAMLLSVGGTAIFSLFAS